VAKKKNRKDYLELMHKEYLFTYDFMIKRNTNLLEMIIIFPKEKQMVKKYFRDVAMVGLLLAFQSSWKNCQSSEHKKIL